MQSSPVGSTLDTCIKQTLRITSGSNTCISEYLTQNKSYIYITHTKNLHREKPLHPRNLALWQEQFLDAPGKKQQQLKNSVSNLIIKLFSSNLKPFLIKN